MHFAVKPLSLTKGARCSSGFDKGALRAMQRSPLVLASTLAVVLAHADVVQAMLPPPNPTSTTPLPTNRSKTTPPPSTPRPIPPAQRCTAYTNASCPIGDRVKRGKDWKWGSQDRGNDNGTVTGAPSGLWCKVKWDNGLSNNYRVGWDGAHDLCLVSASHEITQPPSPAKLLQMCSSDDNNDNGCSKTVDTAWFQGQALHSSILLWVVGGCGFVSVTGLVAMCLFPKRKIVITLSVKVVIFFTFFLFDFSWMGTRFHWLLNSKDARFLTMKTPKEGEYVWIGPGFWRSSWIQRQQLGCPFSRHELQEAPKDACKVWWVSFSADISFQGSSWDEGSAMFSVGVGLLIHAVIEITLFFFFLGVQRQSMEDSEEDTVTETLAKALFTDFLWFLVSIPIVSHQSLVLLPLTSFHISSVCSTMETPAGMNSQTMMCLAKWAMAGLPYGIPMCIGGAICVAGRGLIAALGCLLLITGVPMLLFWIFGGPVVGFWITFGSLDVLADLALVKFFGVTSVAFATTISALVP
jgi:hypothetical protein